jgi:hypothetical protein
MIFARGPDAARGLRFGRGCVLVGRHCEHARPHAVPSLRPRRSRPGVACRHDAQRGGQPSPWPPRRGRRALRDGGPYRGGSFPLTRGSTAAPGRQRPSSYGIHSLQVCLGLMADTRPSRPTDNPGTSSPPAREALHRDDLVRAWTPRPRQPARARGARTGTLASTQRDRPLTQPGASGAVRKSSGLCEGGGWGATK